MTIEKPIKIFSPKLDVVFQYVFGEIGAERIVKEFLEVTLGKEIGKINLEKNPILRRKIKEGKMGILDVLVEIEEKENINIEIQLLEKADVIERILFYWSNLYTKGLKKGEEYKNLKRTVVILIADFEVNGLEELGYHTKWKLIEEEMRKIVLTDKAEIHIIELPKIKGREQEEGKLLDWLFFLDNPESERVEKKMEENEVLKEAMERVYKISEDEEMQRIAELREKALHDEASERATAREKGLKEGLEEGREQGREEGREQRNKEIAKKLLKTDMPIKEIAEITELPIEEIQKLKEQNKKKE